MKEVSIYIPESMSDETISHKKVVLEVVNLCLRFFGGVTIAKEGTGYYIRKDNGSVDCEFVDIVSSIVPSHKEDDIIELKNILVTGYLKRFNQECILVKVSEVDADFIS